MCLSLGNRFGFTTTVLAGLFDGGLYRLPIPVAVSGADSACAASFCAISAIAAILAGVAGTGADTGCAKRRRGEDGADRNHEEELHVLIMGNTARREQEFSGKGGVGFLLRSEEWFFIDCSIQPNHDPKSSPLR